MRASRSSLGRLQSQPCPSNISCLCWRPKRSFSSSAPLLKRPKASHKSLAYADVQRLAKERADRYKAYTPAEKNELAKRYSPGQLAAIEAGEAAIPVSDLVSQAKPRVDPLRFHYRDDFARISGGPIDKRLSKLRGEDQDYDSVDEIDDPFHESERKLHEVMVTPSSDDDYHEIRDLKGNMRRFYAEDDFNELWHKAMQGDADVGIDLNAKGSAESGWLRVTSESDPQVEEYRRQSSLIHEQDSAAGDSTERGLEEVDANTPLPQTYSSSLPSFKQQLDSLLDAREDLPDVAPAIPKVHNPAVDWTTALDKDPSATDDETAEAWAMLAKRLGKSVQELRRYQSKALVMHSVTNQTRLGKIRRTYALAVAGNGDGLLGLGEGKAIDGGAAMRTARLSAIRNLRPIKRYEHRTIFGEVTGKVGAVELVLSSRPPGFGLRTNQYIFEMARVAGLSDLSARVTRSRNPMNTIKAAYNALMSQKDPDDIARARGKKLIDVRKVYYAGNV